MPSAHQSLIGKSPQRSILLIEGYDALAVAVGSALKKFAPQHATAQARSLAEAEALAHKISPALFVIDFDPAYPGLTEFLQKMRVTYPDARVLVIAAGISPEIAAERRSFGALQFIEKPFEVADFGAAVQALLGPWKESASAQSRGTLRSLSLADVMLLNCAGGRTVRIEVKGDGRKSGEIHIVHGALSRAEAGNRSGAQALEEMLNWPQAQMREVENPTAVARTIEGPWARVFLEAFRHIKVQLPVPPAPPKEPAPEKPKAKTGKKIVVIDDTEMLLIFVEDALTTVDPQLRITTALNGTSGIKEIERILPDLVLLDYSLPDFNGDEVCRRLLRAKRTAQIPVLMMSGHVLEMSRTAEAFENVVATIAKPFLSDALITLVHQTLKAEPRPVRKFPEVVKPPQPELRPTPKISEDAAPPEPPPLPPSPVQKLPEVKTVDLPAPPPSSPKERPPRQTDVEHVESTPRVAPPPAITTQQPQVTTATKISAPVISKDLNDVVLGLFVEVVSLQLTPSFRMGTIRAKPSSFTVSLHVTSPTLRAKLPEIGFQLGPVELNGNGRISTVRVIPTIQPFRPPPTRNAFHIGGVAVVPSDARERVQLTPAANSPMTMQLLAHLELAAVELSPTFQLANLVLKNASNTVRVTLSSQAAGQETSGATCETTAIKLDASGRIEELVLNPIK